MNLDVESWLWVSSTHYTVKSIDMAGLRTTGIAKGILACSCEIPMLFIILAEVGGNGPAASAFSVSANGPNGLDLTGKLNGLARTKLADVVEGGIHAGSPTHDSAISSESCDVANSVTFTFFGFATLFDSTVDFAFVFGSITSVVCCSWLQTARIWSPSLR